MPLKILCLRELGALQQKQNLIEIGLSIASEAFLIHTLKVLDAKINVFYAGDRTSVRLGIRVTLALGILF